MQFTYLPRGIAHYEPYFGVEDCLTVAAGRTVQTLTAGAKHRSQVTGLCFTKTERNPKLKLTLGLIRPKQEFLGLRLALMNV